MPYKYSAPDAKNPTTVRSDIKIEFARWNSQAGEEVVTDYDLPLAKNGVREAEVVFALRGGRRIVKVDKWERFDVNLVCCWLIIRDMRLTEARGLTDAVRAAYGLIEAWSVSVETALRELTLTADVQEPAARAVYRVLRRDAHPDAAQGNEPRFKQLRDAWELLCEHRGWEAGNG